MKYIIDLIEDMRQNIQNATDYTLIAMLLKEDTFGNLQNAGEKVITSFFMERETKELHLTFVDGNATTQTLLECINALEMDTMMYQIMVKISSQYPLMQVIGFGENHEHKQYVFFVRV